MAEEEKVLQFSVCRLSENHYSAGTTFYCGELFFRSHHKLASSAEWSEAGECDVAILTMTMLLMNLNAFGGEV